MDLSKETGAIVDHSKGRRLMRGRQKWVVLGHTVSYILNSKYERF